LRHFLAAALFYAGEYTRAAPLFDVVGRDYRRYLAPSDAFDEEADKVLGSRFVLAQMLAAAGRADDALAELESVRPLLAVAFGADSTQVRNLDKHIDRLRSLKRAQLIPGG
jgi:hypothetical protein